VVSLLGNWSVFYLEIVCPVMRLTFAAGSAATGPALDLVMLAVRECAGGRTPS
jgi:hypothetical protein